MPTLKEAKDTVIDLSVKALAVVEHPTMTFGEKKTALDPLEADIKKWQKEVEELDYVEAKRKSFAGLSGKSVEDASEDKGKGSGAAFRKSLGQQFIESDNYKNLVDGGLKGRWTSGDFELKATFAEGTSDAPGGGYSPANLNPTIVPGIVDIKFRTLTIADLFPAGTTSSPLIRYLVETMVTNGAAAVQEGDLKPESALQFDTTDEVLAKIATFLPVTDEMLEDWAQAQSYIDARLLLFVKLEEEAQLLRGDGEDGRLVGLLNREGLAPAVVKGTSPSASDDNSMDAVYRQITAIRTTQFLEPDSVSIDPLGWEKITLSKNEQGAYYANGPFLSETDRTLWSKKVAVTPAMDELSALVGAFQAGGQLFRKGGLTVEASNSHADFFQRNKTAIRAEERLGLAIYRPGAFGLVTGL